MANALRYMEECPLPDGRGRKKPDPHPSLYLRYYTKLKRYFESHQGWTQGPDDNICAHLRRLLSALGKAGKEAKVSQHLIQKARTYTPSDLALEILYVVYGTDPAYLEKKVFPRLRKSTSPLDDWEREVTSRPLDVK